MKRSILHVRTGQPGRTAHATRATRSASVAFLFCLGVLLAHTGSATSLIRASVEVLTESNETVLVGEVLGAHSYWNDDASYILTDVEVAVRETLKGEATSDTVTVTLMGGTVGELTALVVGGASLEVGRSYVLFLDHEDLPGAPGTRTVGDHCQGVFDLEERSDGVRAISQARDQSLVADASGSFRVPGGDDGLMLEDLTAEVRAVAERGASR